jgi:DNA polymerase V
VRTALDLARLDTATLRGGWSVTLEQTARELQGLSCIDLDHAPQPRQQIACTRSFGQPVTTLAPLIEAVSEFTSRAAVRLRAQDSAAGAVLVFVRTSPFRKSPQYSRSVVVPLAHPTQDTARLVGAALHGLRSIYQSGYALAKAGVMLVQLQTCLPRDAQAGTPAGSVATSVRQGAFDFEALGSARDTGHLMKGLDAVNARWGRGTRSSPAHRSGYPSTTRRPPSGPASRSAGPRVTRRAAPRCPSCGPEAAHRTPARVQAPALAPALLPTRPAPWRPRRCIRASR